MSELTPEEQHEIGMDLASAARFLSRTEDPELAKRLAAASEGVYAAALERGDPEVAEAMADSIADTAKAHPGLWDHDEDRPGGHEP